MANEIQGIMKRRGDGRHCVDLSNPNAFLYTEGTEEHPSLSVCFTDEELLSFYEQLAGYISYKRSLIKIMNARGWKKNGTN
jgi:hypothetical protein